MPRRDDIRSIFLLGSGPIVIGQACEFDYSGTQACKALREEGFRVILLNSNPATIMTDPGFADRTYIEPMDPEVAEAIIAREKPDAILPTMGGQTALNLAMALHKNGALERHNVMLIGASPEAIEKAEDRALFKEAMHKIGLELPRSGVAHSLDEARRIADEVGFPCILRPSFTMGGVGGGIVPSAAELDAMASRALRLSPVGTVLVEQNVLGWKEYELEVMRDRADNVVIVCSIENLDPMGVHTGDSITVAPAQTLSDDEYQRMRDAAIRVIREIGVETGGSNIQFAVNPADGRMVVIEMNPRVSRSSALASKATGFPIAKIAARLAVGYTLDEIQNDITRDTPASFEPTIDYVVTKIPRFTFEKFPKTEPVLGSQMKSVGEAMAIGRTFKESFQKALRSLETDSDGLESPFKKDRPGAVWTDDERARMRRELSVAGPRRIWFVGEALRSGMSEREVHDLSKIDPWFVREIAEIVAMERVASDAATPLRPLKEAGYSDRRIALLSGRTEAEVRAAREAAGVVPVFKRVDTCAAEFEAHTPYMYSTYEKDDEARPTERRKIMILGGGPNRIGQGIEFDYCCVHAAFALREAGFETLMVNCNPETVSTDYDTSDRLYFEPLTLEDVLAIARVEKPIGAIVQLGGQTPLKLAGALEKAGVKILGTSPDAIDRAEDRERFARFIDELGLRQPENGAARSLDEAVAIASRIGYPVMVRPSFVLGGRAMECIYAEEDLRRYIHEAVRVSNERPVLIDRFLKDAIEVDVDLVSDGKEVLIGGVMEHIEEAGVHSGDAACALPPFSLSPELIAEMERQSRAMARALDVCGLMNVQFAIQKGTVYVLEVNPRASRTVPFVSKAIGLPLAKIAALCIAGKSLREQGVVAPKSPRHVSVKEAVFPFARFAGVDTLLGPEMKSTGEVMGIADDFAVAFGKAQSAAGNALPTGGRAFISVRDEDKAGAADVARRLVALGFEIIATRGTCAYLRERGVPAEQVNKVMDGPPHVVDRILAGEVQMLFNTTQGKREVEDSSSIRRETVSQNIPYFTTLAAARAATAALEASRKGGAVTVKTLQEYHSAS